MKKLALIFILSSSLALALSVGPKTLNRVVHSHKVVLVKFWASWCVPCSIMKPDFEAAKRELKRKRVTVAEYNVDLGGAPKYGVYTIPTLVLFVNGKAVEQKQGVLDKDSIVMWVDSYLQK